MKSWTKTVRVLRQLVHWLDDRTRFSDQVLGSRALRDSLLPQHWQARVYWRASGELCADKTEYYLCELFATYRDLELEMMAADSRPLRAFPTTAITPSALMSSQTPENRRAKPPMPKVALPRPPPKSPPPFRPNPACWFWPSHCLLPLLPLLRPPPPLSQ